MKDALEELGPSAAWIAQFKSEDIRTAEALLRGLRLVSFSEFEDGIASEITRICAETVGRIAIFAVDKYPNLEARLPSSADKIGYTLTGLERRFPDRIRVRSSLESMRAEKTKHLVLVDDFVGTGGRVTGYWNVWASPSIKSWLSYRKMTLWLVVYAAHESGIHRIRDRITYLDAARVRISIPLPATYSFPNPNVARICDQYGKLTRRANASRGVGDLLSPIVFQHGCPNNAPAILWANGAKWRALFPNRAIPPELYSSFGDTRPGSRNAELLWSAGQYRLALELINSSHNSTKARRQQTLIAVLGLLAKGRKVEHLAKLMTIETRIIDSVVHTAQRAGLVQIDGSLTQFGFDLLRRARRGHRDPDRKIAGLPRAIQFYYPHQCFGVQRKSSNEPA